MNSDLFNFLIQKQIQVHIMLTQCGVLLSVCVCLLCVCVFVCVIFLLREFQCVKSVKIPFTLLIND